MVFSARRFDAAVLVGLAVLGGAATSAHAQVRPPVFNPFLAQAGVNAAVAARLNQNAFNTAVLGRALAMQPSNLGYNPYLAMAGGGYPAYAGATLSTMGAVNPYAGATLATNPYLGGAALQASYANSPGYGGMGGFGGFFPPYISQYLYAANPYNGYLRGAADVTTANGQYLIMQQQARLERERANQEHLVKRRRIIEEAEWERGRIPNPEKVREADLEAALNRARRDPPLTEVWSARSLNSLLNHVAAQQGRGVKGPTIALDPETLKSINLTPADSRANAGLLKDEGKLQWPRSLQGEEFNEPRTRLSRLMEEAVQKLKFNPNNPVPAGLVRDMTNDLQKLNERLNDSVNDLSPSQFIEARRYLNQVGDAVAALSDPKVGGYLNQNWAGKAHNVAELVNFMSRSGMRFAPATPGDEPAYNALYRALADFDAGMQVAQKPASSSSSKE
jgi:hypothetical protein